MNKTTTTDTAKAVERGILKAAWRIFTIIVVIPAVLIIGDLLLGRLLL